MSMECYHYTNLLGDTCVEMSVLTSTCYLGYCWLDSKVHSWGTCWRCFAICVYDYSTCILYMGTAWILPGEEPENFLRNLCFNCWRTFLWITFYIQNRMIFKIISISGIFPSLLYFLFLFPESRGEQNMPPLTRTLKYKYIF